MDQIYSYTPSLCTHPWSTHFPASGNIGGWWRSAESLRNCLHPKVKPLGSNDWLHKDVSPTPLPQHPFSGHPSSEFCWGLSHLHPNPISPSFPILLLLLPQRCCSWKHSHLNFPNLNLQPWVYFPRELDLCHFEPKAKKKKKMTWFSLRQPSYCWWIFLTFSSICRTRGKNYLPLFLILNVLQKHKRTQ